MIPEFKPIPQPPDGYSEWAWIVISTSGGKDSQTAMQQTLLATDAARIPRDSIVASHQCLGKIEWPGTYELVETQCKIHGLALFTSKYRNQAGEDLNLLDYVRKRGKWPDSTNRYCTSEFKRGPGQRILTQLSKIRPGPILTVFGFRAEESPTRAKKIELSVNTRVTRKTRPVWEWLPIHHWKLNQVWEDIRRSKVPYHSAYDLGMARLSCALCVFAPESALMIAGKHNPSLLDEYCDVEEETGHDFQHNKPIRKIREKILAGEKISTVDQDNWKM